MANNDGEIQKSYYAIGEVEKIVGVPASTLRHWEKEFDMLKPKKNRRGNRAYTPKDIALLKRIYYFLNVAEYTTSGALRKLKAKEASPEEQARDTLLKLRSFLVELKETL